MGDAGAFRHRYGRRGTCRDRAGLGGLGRVGELIALVDYDKFIAAARDEQAATSGDLFEVA